MLSRQGKEKSADNECRETTVFQAERTLAGGDGLCRASSVRASTWHRDDRPRPASSRVPPAASSSLRTSGRAGAKRKSTGLSKSAKGANRSRKLLPATGVRFGQLKHVWKYWDSSLQKSVRRRTGSACGNSPAVSLYPNPNQGKLSVRKHRRRAMNRSHRSDKNAEPAEAKQSTRPASRIAMGTRRMATSSSFALIAINPTAWSRVADRSYFQAN